MTVRISSLWTIAELNAEVISLLQADYGSSREAALTALAEHLGRRLQQAEGHLLVLDLRAVELAGAAFLGIVAEFVSRCHKTGRKVLLCGDRLGLLKLVGLNRKAPIHADVASALATCPRPHLAWPSRFSLPLPMLNPAPRASRIPSHLD